MFSTPEMRRFWPVLMMPGCCQWCLSFCLSVCLSVCLSFRGARETLSGTKQEVLSLGPWWHKSPRCLWKERTLNTRTVLYSVESAGTLIMSLKEQTWQRRGLAMGQMSFLRNMNEAFFGH